MMKLRSETGNLMNHVASRYVHPAPAIGMGATILHWSDREPCTIVKITPTQIHVRLDKAIRLDKNGMSESQEYSYEQDFLAPIQVFRNTKRGYRNSSGNGLCIGTREKYYDYSF